jgi:hypothetical protein
VAGDPPVAVMSVAASRQALYECCADDVAESAIARQQPQPVAPFVAPVSIPAGALDRISQYAVVCTRDRAIPPPLQRRMAEENACADVVEIDTDHTPQLSRPDELAKALDRFAKHVARGSTRCFSALEGSPSVTPILFSVKVHARDFNVRKRRNSIAA